MIGTAAGLSLLVGAGLGFGPTPVPAPAEAAVAEPATKTVREAVYPALVNLTVVRERFTGGRTQRFPGAGSGVIVTDGGHVVTNYHVAGDATRITATLTDGRVFDAEVVAHDPLSDLSILVIEASEGVELAHAEFGDSDRLEVGDTVFALGNPLALSSSLTRGIVSNPARVFTDPTGSEKRHLQLGEGEMSGLFTRWIQHDAVILPGNSGGPLVDSAGRVVGINELGGPGIGFAIPSNLVRRVLAQVLDDGDVERGWLGFSVLPVEKLERSTGALVSDVLPGSPAAAAGVVPGEVLTKMDGEPVTVRFFEEVPLLYQRIAELAIGAEVELTLEEGGEGDGGERTVTADVEPMDPFTGEEDEVRRLGITVQEITEPMAVFRQLTSTEGLLVTGIRPGGATDAAKPQVRGDDVLVEIAGRDVPETVAAFRDLVATLPTDEEILLSVRRRDEEILSVVPPITASEGAWGGELPKAWVGLRTQVVTAEIADQLELSSPGGFRITQVLPWTRAIASGFERGDIVVALDGQPVEASRLQEAEDLRRRIEERPVGEVVTFTVLRDGERRQVDTELEERPASPDDLPTAEQEELEFSVRELAFLDRIENRWQEGVDGVVVSDLTRGGWAQMAGLRLDDLIIEVADRPVPDVDRFEEVMAGILERRPDVLSLFVRRGFRTHFVLIEPDWAEIFPAEEA